MDQLGRTSKAELGPTTRPVRVRAREAFGLGMSTTKRRGGIWRSWARADTGLPWFQQVR